MCCGLLSVYGLVLRCLTWKGANVLWSIVCVWFSPALPNLEGSQCAGVGAAAAALD
jgi:hypothetical protein